MQHTWKLLAVVSFACASSATAAPDTAPQPAPARRPDACRPGGAVIFEIDHRVDPGAKLPTSAVKVFAGGAWTRDATDAEGKAAAALAGCLAKADLQQLQTTLAGATWKITVAEFRCMAISSEFTVYQVHGKPVFTQRLCSGETLDKTSRSKLDAAIALVEGEVAKAAPRP